MLNFKKIVLSAFILTAVVAGLFGYSHASSIIGDLNGDGVVDSTDATLMQRYILGMLDYDIEGADINGDGEVDSTDYTLLKRYILELIDDLSIYNDSNDYEDDSDYDLFRVSSGGEFSTAVEVIHSNAYLEEVLGEYLMNSDIEEALEKYTDEYLEDNGLIFVSLEERSGSISHELEDVQFNNGTCTLTINKYIPEILTDDMAHWVFLIPVDKSQIDNTEKIEIKLVEEHEEKTIEYRAIKAGQPINVEYPAADRINSNSELVDLFEGIEIKEFENVIEKYTDEYLERNGLVLLAFEETSGSINLDIENFKFNEEILDIDMLRHIPCVGTCDMAYWVFLIDVPLSILDEISDINVNITDEHEECEEDEKEEDEKEEDEKDGDEKDGDEKDGELGYQIFRATASVEEYPAVEVIKSNSQLMNMFSDYLSEEAEEILSEYDDEYFDTGELVFIALEEASGSISHELAEKVFKDGLLTVDIERFVPFIGTDDMAYWVFLIEAPLGVNEVRLNIESEYEREEDGDEGYEIVADFKTKTLPWEDFEEADTPVEMVVSSVSELQELEFFELVDDEEYTDGFFENNDLLMCIFRDGGNMNYELEGATIRDNQMNIYVEAYDNGLNPVMAARLFAVTVNKGLLEHLESVNVEISRIDGPTVSNQ
ncbi:dockerin type I repeat-containing protein [Herbivorax sp. ANBcel31]|uniref:dockerin type I repeat-containing protein n=1 Tax=Herbivorax sp. ANBcel31 TaxID=3069754 RepID=UPI0027B69E6C|nr:dockerin type I repeat-containing protein [Herbivorax sp. ANBcel31]MDQ2085597.1 dockerin type I repeat-containing protein [Herbivorax sp. ANBcel31]